MQPWQDRSGQVSLLKLFVFLALFAPGAWTLGAYFMGQLGARPLTEIIHQTGLWTLRFLFISLAITPLRRTLHLPKLVLVRRMIGVAAFAYGLAHLGTYIVDESFAWRMVVSEILLRVYLTIGFAALLLLSVLAATSTDGMIKRIGGRRWRWLHRLAYAIGVLALFHYFMQSKLGFGEPLLMAGLFGWAMGYRIVGWVRRDENALTPLVVVALSLTAGLATALGEAIYVALSFHVGIWRVLSACLAWAPGSRSAWAVAAIGLIIAAGGSYRARTKPKRPSRSRIVAAGATV
jgi:methionine sulfoxide reductase heme-binding subunit